MSNVRHLPVTTEAQLEILHQAWQVKQDIARRTGSISDMRCAVQAFDQYRKAYEEWCNE